MVEAIAAISRTFLDAAVLVDENRRVLHFNHQFFALFPKSLARRLEGQLIDDLLCLELGGDGFDPISEALVSGSPRRYDEAKGLFTDGPTLSLIVSATPLLNDSKPWACLVLLRDVTDLADVQSKYRQLQAVEAQARARLESKILEQGKLIVERGEELRRMQEELTAYRKKLFI
ncbi:MAG: hypothetical protein AUK47_24080 [Deltaproteobacteria bacterium CG2_30_63_29]|nr:MAG: hypothetical protein AUK47_24080 [Deltaproteobacteria bacterium CG2_30_63_29]PIV99601.1 MAG: hypothetical protein COW42_10510 [Deltaproteobacteria bacterium CG17_big_fil_post_rev_8_21_14_2_50_63_7]PJB41932.1 MAG: hypothetical protein CO108_12485 [Deltaproteobacteria bacterium CG_4_9_14_3_um_filter_63_12]